MNSILKKKYNFINQSICLILVSLFMRFYTNFQFYNFKILSVILFTIFAFIIDAFIYERQFYFSNIILNIFFNVLYSVELNYRKYLMDKKYISLYIIISFCGVIDFIILSILEIITIKNENRIYFNNEKLEIPIQYKDIKTKWYIILFSSIPIFVCFSIHIIIFYLLIYYFTSTHAVVIDTIKLYLQTIILFNNGNLYKLLIVLFLCFFGILSLFIFLEIIELKFCGLNNNIRKNILKRMEKDNFINEFLEGTESDEIDINDEYSFELEKQK